MSSTPRLRLFLELSSLATLALVMSGCGIAQTGVLGLLVVLGGAAAMTLGACTYYDCCQDGMLATCSCPPNTSCNYLGHKVCADGSCVLNGFDEEEEALCPGEVRDGGSDGSTDQDGDSDTADAGTYEACCEDGQLTTCYCPPSAACNYGLGLNDCGDGTCGYEPDACASVDGGAADLMSGG